MAVRLVLSRLASPKRLNFRQGSLSVARFSNSPGDDDGTPSQDEEMMTPPLPPFKEYKDESTELTRARLLYQSRKRGMLENGLLLSCFADKHLDKLNENQLVLYDKLINEPTNDWDIYYWITGVRPTPEYFDNEIMNMLKQFVQNENRNSRIVQPDL